MTADEENYEACVPHLGQVFSIYMILLLPPLTVSARRKLEALTFLFILRDSLKWCHPENVLVLEIQYYNRTCNIKYDLLIKWRLLPFHTTTK